MPAVAISSKEGVVDIREEYDEAIHGAGAALRSPSAAKQHAEASRKTVDRDEATDDNMMVRDDGIRKGEGGGGREGAIFQGGTGKDASHELRREREGG